MAIYSNFKERILQTNFYNDIQFYPSGSAFPLNQPQFLPNGVSVLMVALCSGSLGPINHADTIYVNHSEAWAGSVARHEIYSPNYVLGGKPIQNISGERLSNGRVVISGSPLTWTGISSSIRYAVLYISGALGRTGSFTGLRDGVVSTGSNDYWSYLVAHIDLGTQNVTSSDFTINWNPAGILVFD